ncbi:MAG: PAS domain S-box protein, partial [Bacteroidetes bacterium]|nr:PAS domain S-box protein [Bacteroidota bacterium]
MEKQQNKSKSGKEIGSKGDFPDHSIKSEGKGELNTYHELLDNAPIIFQLLDREGKLIEVNKLWLTTMGYEKEEIIGKYLGEYLSDNSRKILEDSLSMYREHKTHYEKILEIRKKDGSYIQFDCYSMISHDRGGVFNNMLCFLEEKKPDNHKNILSFNETILNAIPEIIFRIDKNGKFIDYHTNSDKAIAMKPENFIGKHLDELDFPVSFVQRSLELIAKALETNKIQKYEYDLETFDGLKYFEARIVPVSKNEILDIVCDVTERLKTEKLLKQSEEQFRNLYYNIPVGIYQTTPEGKILMANPAMAKILEYNSVEELLNMDLADPGFDLLYKKEDFQNQIKEKDEIIGREDVIRTWNGDIKYIRENARAIRNDSGDIIFYEGTIEDITSQKLAQEDLRKTEREKIAILNSMSELFVYYDTGLKILWASKAAAELMGLRNEELVGKNCYEVWQKKDEPCIDCPVLKAKETGKPYSSEMKTPDGRILHITGYPVLNEEGEIIGMTELGQDITMQKKFEEELKKSKENAEKANRFKSKFLSNLSHEVRTPLNIIIGFANLLDNNVNDKKLKEYISSIKSSSNSILELIDDILDISRIETGNLDLQFKSVNLFKIIKEIKQMFVMKSSQKQLDFFVEIDENIPKYLILDEVRIKQILTNLVSNAIKYTDRGYVKIIVQQTKERSILGSEEIDLRFIVEDTGVGIPESEWGHLFEPFTQVKSRDDNNRGYGLGLAITKSLVEMMDATISIKSEIDKGSSFFVDIPAVMVHKFSLSFDQEPDDLEVDLKGRTVLLVDDSDINRKLVKENLENAGIKIIEAHDGQVAITMAEKHKPELILMDILMPRMDGFEATRLIRNKNELTGIPIIALTALAMKEDVERIEKAGFDAYLLKPFHISDLFEKVNKIFKSGHQKEDTQNVEETGELKPEIVGYDIQKAEYALEKLTEDYMAIWHEISKNKEFQQIQNFAFQIHQLGEETELDFVKDFGMRLENFAKEFDVENIDICLESYPNLIDKVKSCIPQ